MSEENPGHSEKASSSKENSGNGNPGKNNLDQFTREKSMCARPRVVWAALFLGLLSGTGMAGAGFLVSKGIADFRLAERYVTVKGLVERELEADLATWPLIIKSSGDDLAATQGEMEANLGVLSGFLKENGFTEAELSTRPPRVIDRMAAEYGGEMRAGQARYIVESGVMIRSNNVALVQKVSQMTNALVRAGVALTSDSNSCVSGPNYVFTRLNAIKPEMLAEATRNARASANQFAADSGSRVGGIRRAYQGVFSISGRDEVSGDGMGGGGCGISDPNKKIRVVTTVDYYLEN